MENYEIESAEANFTGNDVCPEKDKSNTNQQSSMLILTTEDILKTYPEYEAESARKYYEFLNLRAENPTFGYKKLAKMLGVKDGRTRCWKQWNGKPTPILAIEKLTQVGLLPFYSDNPKIPAVLRLLGAGFTDGGIDKNLNTFHFNSARMENIMAWKKDFLEIFPFAEEKLSAIITGKNQSSIGVRTTERAIVRFFSALGCPVGNKTMVSYSLPAYLLKLSQELRAAFLDGFFSCEASLPPVTTFSISMSKIEEKEAEHIQFLSDFCTLCQSIGIEHTSINKVPQKKILEDGTSRRKDGRTCDSFRILFSYKPENVMKTHSLIPLTYAHEKKIRFDKLVAQYKEKIAKRPKTSKGEESVWNLIEHS